MAKKNYTGQLFEICQKNTQFSNPEFFVNVQQGSNPPIFDCICNIEYEGELIQVAAKSSDKQSSKHQAARFMIQKLMNEKLIKKSGGMHVLGPVINLKDQEIAEDFTLMLLEICTIHTDWSMPRYNFTCKEDVDHTLPICTCTVFTPKHNYTSFTPAGDKTKAMKLASKEIINNISQSLDKIISNL